MTNYKCTWCNKEVNEQDFDIHAKEHYAEQIRRKYHNPITTLTTVASVSYVKES